MAIVESWSCLAVKKLLTGRMQAIEIPLSALSQHPMFGGACYFAAEQAHVVCGRIKCVMIENMSGDIQQVRKLCEMHCNRDLLVAMILFLFSIVTIVVIQRCFNRNVICSTCLYILYFSEIHTECEVHNPSDDECACPGMCIRLISSLNCCSV